MILIVIPFLNYDNLFISFIRLKMTQIMSENIKMFAGIIKDLSPVIIPLAMIYFFSKFLK